MLCYLEVEFDVDCMSFSINHFESVTSITIHVSMTVRNAAITKQETHLMGRLWTKGDEVPKHVWVLKEKSL